MIELDFVLAPNTAQVLDLALADESSLRYRAFLGDLVFRLDSADFSTSWGWVPALDVAWGLAHVRDELKQHDEVQFEFTESDHCLRFSRSGGAVCVAATYVEDEACIPSIELRAAIFDFVERTINRLSSEWPSLRQNPVIRKGYAPGP